MLQHGRPEHRYNNKHDNRAQTCAYHCCAASQNILGYEIIHIGNYEQNYFVHIYESEQNYFVHTYIYEQSCKS